MPRGCSSVHRWLTYLLVIQDLLPMQRLLKILGCGVCHKVTPSFKPIHVHLTVTKNLFFYCTLRSREYMFTHMNRSTVDIPFLSEALSGERIWVILKVANLMRKVWHYHLQVQANPKKWHKKTDAIFSIYGKNGIIPWHFFHFSPSPPVTIVKPSSLD